MSVKNNPDPTALAIASEMQKLLAPAQVILNGSRAVGQHRPDSDVDLMSVFDDEGSRRLADEALALLLKPYDDGPPVHVYTIVRDEFERLALMAQSFPGQAVRHGVTPEGKPLDYRPERPPSPAELREGADFWRQLAQIELREFLLDTDEDRPFSWRIAPLHTQYAGQWAVKRLLYLANDPVRYRRDLAVMWRHIQSVRPLAIPDRIEAVEQLLAVTATPGREGCVLTGWVEAFRRHRIMPVLDNERWAGLRATFEPAFRALMAESDERGGHEP